MVRHVRVHVRHVLRYVCAIRTCVCCYVCVHVPCVRVCTVLCAPCVCVSHVYHISIPKKSNKKQKQKKKTSLPFDVETAFASWPVQGLRPELKTAEY